MARVAQSRTPRLGVKSHGKIFAVLLTGTLYLSLLVNMYLYKIKVERNLHFWQRFTPIISPIVLIWTLSNPSPCLREKQFDWRTSSSYCAPTSKALHKFMWDLGSIVTEITHLCSLSQCGRQLNGEQSRCRTKHLFP